MWGFEKGNEQMQFGVRVGVACWSPGDTGSSDGRGTWVPNSDENRSLPGPGFSLYSSGPVLCHLSFLRRCPDALVSLPGS